MITPAQQPALRKLLSAAWHTHRVMLGIPEDAGGKCPRGKRCKLPECAYCQWYEDTIEAATGHRSMTECNASGDYEQLMAQLERIARTAGDYWQRRCASGAARTILHACRRAWPACPWDERYLDGIILRMGFYGTLHTLPAEQLAAVRVAAVKQARREVKVKVKVPDAGEVKVKVKVPDVETADADFAPENPF